MSNSNKEGLGAREYLNHALDLLIDDPHPALDKIKALSDEEIVGLTRDYLTLVVTGDEQTKTEGDTAPIVSVEDARYALDAYLDDVSSRQRDVIEQRKSSTGEKVVDLGYSQRSTMDRKFLEMSNPGTAIADQLRSLYAPAFSPLLDAIRDQQRSQLLSAIQPPSWMQAKPWLPLIQDLQSTQTQIPSLYRQFILDQTVRPALSTLTSVVAEMNLASIIQERNRILNEVTRAARISD